MRRTSLFLASQAHAENRWGVLAGVNFAKLSSSVSNSTSDSKTGFLGGVYSQWEMTDGFYFEPALRFSQKGADGVDLDYLELPLYVRYKIATGGPFVPSVYVGPAAAFRVGATVGSTSGTAISDLFKSFDLSIDAGIGGEFAVNDSMHLGLNVGYSLGLLNIADGVLQTALGNENLKNRGFNLYASSSWAF